jgi:serine protease Do
MVYTDGSCVSLTRYQAEETSMSVFRKGVSRRGILVAGIILSGAVGARSEDVPPAAPPGLPVFEQNLIDLIARSEGAVVAIARVLPEDLQADDLPRDPFGFQAPTGPVDSSFIPREFGSGVILAREPDDGARYVLTPRHVITGSRQRRAKQPEDVEYFIKLASRHVVRGVLYNQDEHSDLAVLKLDLESVGLTADKVPMFSFGEAEKLRKGSVVVGLGNPYAIARDGSASASLGLISNISRRTSEGERRPDAGEESVPIFEYGALLHVDLRLQLGTSGAAIVNTEGKLVGLATSLAALRGYESSVGFAIPFDTDVRRIVKSLLDGQEVEYGFLGVMPVDATLSGQRERSGQWLPVSSARLYMMAPQSPADQAGLKQGDCVLAVNGHPISGSAELMLKVGLLGPGAAVRLDIWRPQRGERLEVEVRLGKWPVYDDTSIIAPHPLHPAWRGFTVDYPTARRRFMPTSPLSRYHRAVVVTQVDEGGAASKAGLQVGTMISHVAGQAVQTPGEFAAAVEGKSGRVELMLVDGKRVTVEP